MKINYITIGPLQSNCYLLEKNNQYLLIDPGEDYNQIKKFIQNKNITGILITHNHYDHTASVNNLIKDYYIKIYSINNLKEGQNKIGSFNFEVIYTKGHTMDSITYYFYEDKVMFTGDFLFKGTIGRCDFTESNKNEMIKSIKKIKQYNENITIYPGHGEKTTLKNELQNNPYLRLQI